MNFKEFCKKFEIIDIIKYFPKIDYEKISLKKRNLYEGNFYNEEWKKIDFFNYEVSNYGRIRNITTKNIKQLKFNKYGNQITLWKNSKGITFTISNLVANYFIKPLKEDERVFHKDKNIRNNYFKNLIIEKMR